MEFTVKFEWSKEDEILFLERVFEDGRADRQEIDKQVIREIEEEYKFLDWRRSRELGRNIGSRIFRVLNGDRQVFFKALKNAENLGQRLQLNVMADGPALHWPFELLFNGDFLLPHRVDVVRRFAEGDKKEKIQTEDRPLKMLFMACSPVDVEPVLDFEKEEDSLYQFTENLPIHIDVEDTGSLEGLENWLDDEYDIVHLSGHADIDRANDSPFFWMETELGEPVKVTPEDLYGILEKNPPSILFLSGCRTGQAPDDAAAYSFSRHMVMMGIPAVIGWGLPVSDSGAIQAARKFYHELGTGKDILQALHLTRRLLFHDNIKDWSLLRLEANRAPLDIPLVLDGQTLPPKGRSIQNYTLEGSQVKVLGSGFIGRRRQIQNSLRALKNDTDKIGLLIHGTGGLGKSCLAGKLCQRFPYHTLIIVHGVLDAITLMEAIKKGLQRSGDDDGAELFEKAIELPDKMEMFCQSIFKNRNYLILFDDFEQNFPNAHQGDLSLSNLAEETLKAILLALPHSEKQTQLIITSRYLFALPHKDEDLVETWLQPIGLDSFQGADLKKKLCRLDGINRFHDKKIRQQLIAAGRGNPRLMEAIDTLVMESPYEEIGPLLKKVSKKGEEFVQRLTLLQIAAFQPKEFNQFLRYMAVFSAPVPKQGLEHLYPHIPGWEFHIRRAVRLSLMETTSQIGRSKEFWVTPLLRQELFDQLPTDTQLQCHQSAVDYYQGVVYDSENLSPHPVIQLIHHAIKASMPDEAVDAGGILLEFLRETLAYPEALHYGYSIKHIIPESKRDSDYSLFWSLFGAILQDTGHIEEALEYFEEALSIDREVYGELDQRNANHLTNIGGVYHTIGEYHEAIEYYEAAKYIVEQVEGEINPTVATLLSNLGGVYHSLGEFQEAVDSFETAIEIGKEVYGENHSMVATYLNNLGMVYKEIEEYQTAMELYHQALEIIRIVDGEDHPNYANILSNLGIVYNSIGNHKLAIECTEKALNIDINIFGEEHPKIATRYSNMGTIFNSLEDYDTAIELYEKAMDIDIQAYGENHPKVATRLNNLGSAYDSLGDYRRAIEYYRPAYEIFYRFLGEDHPKTQMVEEKLQIAMQR